MGDVVVIRRDSDVGDGCTYSFKGYDKGIGADPAEFGYDFG